MVKLHICREVLLASINGLNTCVCSKILNNFSSVGVFIIGIKIHCQSSYDTPIILSAPQQLLKKSDYSLQCHGRHLGNDYLLANNYLKVSWKTALKKF